MHAASTGEFEQGKPILEALKKSYPKHKILVSFFSPSGYFAAKNTTAADVITYLPLDTAKNAKRFLQLAQPDLVIFVKYDFWFHFLAAVNKSNIPLILISAVFRKRQVFFKWYGGFYRKMMFFFNHIFAQDAASVSLLQKIGVAHASTAGDTRFDRVVEIAQQAGKLPAVEKFIAGKPTVVAGSTWPADEICLSNLTNCKLIIAPHEITETHLKQIEKQFTGTIRYSQLYEGGSPAGVLIIDNIGMLSRLYQYAAIAYVGGGFTKDGIHNILEAAVYGKPIIFGPNYKKYREARELIAAGGAFSFPGNAAFQEKVNDLWKHPLQLQNAGRAAATYVQENTGATNIIMRYLQEKRLLTNR